MEIHACAHCLVDITRENKKLYFYESLCNECIATLAGEHEIIKKSNKAISPNSSLGETHDHETYFRNNPLHKSQPA